MIVRLKHCPPDPDALAAWAAAICTRSRNPESSLDRAMDAGHLSIAEHAAFTFEIEGVSRALLAQLTRHRIASYSVESQRYVSAAKCYEYVMPPAIEALGREAMVQYRAQMEMIHNWYCGWQEQLKQAGRTAQQANEDARYVLPNACATRIGVTMNARELMHFFELRCCRCAQWEIRQMAWQMLRLCRAAAPTLFADAGPGCLRGACPEGEGSCGRPYRKENVK